MTSPHSNGNQADSCARVLGHFSRLGIPLRGGDLDAALSRAERERQSHLEFLESLIAQEAGERPRRRLERRIREAHFPEVRTLENFDWAFNAKAIDRVQIEALASGDFIRRRENLVMIGQSGAGKSHLIQAIARQACVLDYRVRYWTSAGLLTELTASLADKSLPEKLRYYSRCDLLVIDEFGMDKIERTECPEAANLLYKVIDSRTKKRSTALVTNVDFEDWKSYLPDAPLAMALLDRLVDGAGASGSRPAVAYLHPIEVGAGTQLLAGRPAGVWGPDNRGRTCHFPDRQGSAARRSAYDRKVDVLPLGRWGFGEPAAVAYLHPLTPPGVQSHWLADRIAPS
jgi:DNA replication protein DnaC